MKMKTIIKPKTHLKIITSLTLALSLSACAPNVDSGFSGNLNGDSNLKVPTEPKPINSDEDAAGTSSLGVKNYRQIYETFLSVTGITLTANDTIRTFYNGSTASLPQSNDPKTFNSNHILTTFNLAYEFCNALTTRAAERQRFFQGTAMGAVSVPLPTIFNDANQKLLIVKKLVDAFWGEELSPSSARNDAIQKLLTLVDEVRQGLSTATSTTTSQVVTGVCTSALANANTILF